MSQRSAQNAQIWMGPQLEHFRADIHLTAVGAVIKGPSHCRASRDPLDRFHLGSLGRIFIHQPRTENARICRISRFADQLVFRRACSHRSYCWS
jgi:hypothetical protein